MGLMRIRVSSFLSGFAVAAGISLYQLKKDLQDSHALLREQGKGVEERLSKLEALVDEGSTQSG